MATFHIDIGTDYIEAWLTGLQTNYEYMREYTLTVYDYNDEDQRIGEDMSSDHELDEDNPSESPHLIVTGLKADTHYIYKFICYDTGLNEIHVDEQDDFWTNEEAVYYYVDYDVINQEVIDEGTMDQGKSSYITDSGYDKYTFIGFYVAKNFNKTTALRTYNNNEYSTSSRCYEGDGDFDLDSNWTYMISLYEPADTGTTYSGTLEIYRGTSSAASNEWEYIKYDDGRIDWVDKAGTNTECNNSTRDDWSFQKWAVSDTDTIGVYSTRDDAVLAGYSTVYGVYTASDTITYYPQNGNPSGTRTRTHTLYGKGSLSTSNPLAPSLSYSGYTLQGWATSATGPATTWANAIASSTTVYAIWQENTYQYTLNTADHVTIQTNATPSGKYAPGTTITLSASVAAGYSFKQWTSSNTSLVPHKTTSTASFFMPSGDIEMTPEVTLNTYTITYNLNEGTQGSNATINYNINTATFNLPIPTKANYAFVGWYDNSSFTGNRITQITKGSYGNKTYYAKWALIQTFYWTNTNYSSNGAAQYLHDLTTSNGIAINWYAPTAQVQDFINKINTYCGTSLTFNEKQLLTDYNALVNALNNSSAPDHLSGTTTPSLSTKPTDDYISSDDLIALENAFNNRKFI